MKKIIKVTVWVVVLILVLGIAKNAIAKAVLSSAVSTAARVPVRIGSVNLSFLSASIRIKNFKLSNPSGYPEKIMVDIPQIFIDFDPGALLKGRAHFEEVRLEIKQLTVIKNKDGKTNVEAVKPSTKEKKQPHEKANAASGGKAPKLHIDKLVLSIGQVVYKDYSAGGEPQVQSFDINIKDREYTDIDNPAQVVSLVMFEALTRTSLSRLANLDIDSFKEGGIQALSKGLGAVTDGTEAVSTTAKQLLGSILN